MKVLLYGRLAEAIGPETDVGTSPGCSVATVRERLIADHPEAESLLRAKRALTFIGDRLVRDDDLLADGDMLEFLPPVSGG